jgi:hypothetical protein
MLQRLVLASLLLSAGLSAQVTVVNAASFAPGAPITAGSWAAAFGTFQRSLHNHGIAAVSEDARRSEGHY